MAFDSQELKQWIGRQESVEDILTPGLVNRFHATLGLPGKVPTLGEAAPRLIHFCLCHPITRLDELAEDGHPALGGFLPPVPLPRRMWAAGAIEFFGDIRVGDNVVRVSRISDVSTKVGRSGELCFVDVEHLISAGGITAVSECQTIVYRASDRPAGGVGISVSGVGPAPVGQELTR